MPEIALGVTVLTRIERLERLLRSAEDKSINTVYVADHGDTTSQKESLYNRTFSFCLEVLDLEENESLGYSRNRIVDESSEEYLLIVDSDHELPNNVMKLADQLDERPDIGGIAGAIIEPNKGRIWQSSKDFYEDENVLFRSPQHENKDVQYVSGSPFVEFDFIPNAAIFRRSCLEDQGWDSNCPFGRGHADFYVGHWKRTEWIFGVSPEVLFKHYPGGDAEYVSGARNSEKHERARKYFLDKWGYDDFRIEEPYWYDTHYQRLTLFDRARRIQREDGSKVLMKRGLKKVARTARQNVLDSN